MQYVILRSLLHFCSIFVLSISLAGCELALNATPATNPSPTASSAPVVDSVLLVAIARETAQLENAYQLPIVFDVTFDHAVTDFDAADVTFNGGTDGITFNVTGTGAQYKINVTAVNHNRRIIPSVTTAFLVGAEATVSYVPIKFKEVHTGANFNAALTAEGMIYYWSDGAPAPINTASMAGEKIFTQLAVGRTHACAINTQGVAYCFGSNSNGQKGNGTAAFGMPNFTASLVVTTSITGEKTFKKIWAGHNISCGVMTDGAAYCWGDNSWRGISSGAPVGNVLLPWPIDTSTITGEKEFAEIVPGFTHSCGITVEGVAYCWGYDSWGALGDGILNQGTGRSETPSPVDMTNVTGEKTFRGLSLGYRSSCALTGDGVAYCWGSGSDGLMGDGNDVTTNIRPVAVDSSPIAGEKAFKQVTMQTSHACGITFEGIAYCWGQEDYGQLGNGAVETDYQVIPYLVDSSAVPLTDIFKQISATGVINGITHALSANGNIYRWGEDPEQNGNDLHSPTLMGTDVLTSDLAFIQVTSGNTHSCGLTAQGLAYCWGSDTDGQLGNGSALTGKKTRPSLVDTSTITGSKIFTQITAGANHTCAIMADSAVYCWGSDSNGQLGNAATAGSQVSPSPVDRTGIAGLKSFLQISAKANQTCGLTLQGIPYCWGSDSNGQLGNGATAGDQVAPSLVDTTTVAGKKSFKQISVGSIQTCGITFEGVAYCWGSDTNGRLGNGATAGEQASPSAVDTTTITGKKSFVHISTNSTQTCGLTSEQIAYCWGSDSNGQLGNGAGTTADQVSPSLVDVTGVAGKKTMIAITSGSSHACGIMTDGLIYCWGSDSSGQLGNGAGTTADQVVPSLLSTTDITGDKGFIELSIGTDHSCGLTGKGVTYCFGANTDGQMGSGTDTVTPQVVPLAVDLSRLN